MLKYITRMRDFPKLWTEGLRSAVFKSGFRLNAGNYRGITILPIIEKIFEIVVYNRLSFANKALDKEDKYNGGFRAGCRTSDDIFILHGLIQRQLWTTGQTLLCALLTLPKHLISTTVIFYSTELWKVAGMALSLTRCEAYTVKLHFESKITAV